MMAGATIQIVSVKIEKSDWKTLAQLDQPKPLLMEVSDFNVNNM